MSTFSEFNGPMNNGPSVKAITEMITAYETLNRKLEGHINASANSEAKPHNITALIESEVATINRSIATLRNELDNKAPADNYITRQVLNDIIDDYYDKNIVDSKLADKANVSSLNNYYDKEAINTKVDDLTTRINTERDRLQNYINRVQLLDNDLVLLQGVLKATDSIKGYIKAHRIIDFTKWQTVAMQFAGTGAQEDASTNGLYVLGKLSHNWEDDDHAPHDNLFKAARAFIKYENGHPFDAIIDMTATRNTNNVYTGSITAQVSKQAGEWSNLRFHLVHATSYDNNDIDEVYLCMSADGLYKGGDYSNLYVHVAGINFIPLDDNETKRVSLVSAPITWTASVPTNVNNTTVFSTLSTGNIITDRIFDETGQSIVKVDHIYDELNIDHRVVTVGDIHDGNVQFLRRPVLLTQNENGTLQRDRFITLHDIEDMKGAPIGVMCLWPLYDKTVISDEDGIETCTRIAKDVPQGWAACDGSEVDAELGADYIERFGTNKLPIFDCAIIKIKNTLTSIPDDLDPEVALSYNELSDLIKILRQGLKREIDRSTGEDAKHDSHLTTHDQQISALDGKINLEAQIRGAADNNLLSNDRQLRSADYANFSKLEQAIVTGVRLANPLVADNVRNALNVRYSAQDVTLKDAAGNNIENDTTSTTIELPDISDIQPVEGGYQSQIDALTAQINELKAAVQALQQG